MSQKLTVAVPRLASTILVLAQNPHAVSSNSHTHDNVASGNDIHVLMMKRHGKARFMPSVYVFPGGGVDVADYRVAQDYLADHYDVHTTSAADTARPPASFMEARINPTPEEGEAEAWACRVGALRELAEEAACVLQRDSTICTAAQWRARSAASPSGAVSSQHGASSPTAAAAPPHGCLCDVDASPLLRPVGRWVTPRHFKYRYDTYFYAALVRGAAPSGSSGSAAGVCPAQSLALTAQASEVEDLLWLSPREALRRHENKSDTFSLAPPTFLLLHALARQPSYAALANTWAATAPSCPAPSVDGDGGAAGGAARVGKLPYCSVLPCVEPRSRMTKDKKYIEHFMLPEHYLYERGWSEPAGAYRFCGEAFADQTHEIRLWVGQQWVQKVKDGGAEVANAAARELVH